jgi:hypothetical protein
MNSSPKQYPLRWRTTAIIRKRHGVPNSTSSKSPGFSRIPAYKPMPPSLSSVPRPETVMVEHSSAMSTLTGKSMGCRCHRRLLGEEGILADDDPMHFPAQITKGVASSALPPDGNPAPIVIIFRLAPSEPLNRLAVTTVCSGRGAGICMELIPFSGPGAYAVFNEGRFLFLRDVGPHGWLAATVS